MTRLKFERTRLKLSQHDVAKVARIPQPQVSQIERGRLIPMPHQLQRLALVFDVPAEDLLKEVVVIERAS